MPNFYKVGHFSMKNQKKIKKFQKNIQKGANLLYICYTFCCIIGMLT